MAKFLLQNISETCTGKIHFFCITMYLVLKKKLRTFFRGDGDEESEPDWVKAEREAFADHRDENGDGFMDLDEVRKWILPAGTQLYSIRYLFHTIFA